MAGQKITQKPIADALKDDAYFLVTQTETVDGKEAEALRRVPRHMVSLAAEEKLLLLELLKTAVYKSNTANQNYSKLLAAWKSDVSALADARPQIISVTPDKTNIKVGESVTFTVVQKNAASIRFIVDEAVNERIYDVTQETITFTKSFQSAGNGGIRIIAFQAVDSAGNLGLESTKIAITCKEE